MRFSTFFFDLDETLYPPSSGLWGEIRDRINAYMKERMGFSGEQIEVLRDAYFRQYGTTLRGLQANYPVDTEDYLAFVHDVPLEPYLRPDPALRAVLESLNGRLFILTNSDRGHVARVTSALGLDGLWAGVIDVHVLAPYCKPMPEAFERALQAAGAPDPGTCVLLDDQARITRAARALGLRTILVGKETPGEDADQALPELTGLPEVLRRM